MEPYMATYRSPRNGHEFDAYGLLYAVFVFLVFASIFLAVRFVTADMPTTSMWNTTQPEAQYQAKSNVAAKKEPAYKEPRFVDAQTIAEVVPDEGKFITADLDTMTLFLYEDGQEIDSYEILSRGEPGSRWDTPSGVYEVAYMNPSHFSSIGDVYMPYSLQFYGNFFIHGWPYYPSGTDVPEGYSGGCIRLSTQDSKEVFEFAEKGVGVFVHETYDETSQDGSDPETLKIDPTAQPPSVSARAFLVADLDTGQVYTEKNPDTSLPIASITKLMTALVANETIASERTVRTTSRAAEAGGNSGDLAVGETMTQSDMLYPLLLPSGNDAAYALADHYGKAYFSFLMNKQARALGMENSYFEDASGLSSENVASVNDLFALSRYIHERKQFLFDITAEENKEIFSSGVGAQQHSYRNIHPLRNTEGYTGGKNGFIRASRQTLLTLFERELNGKPHTIAVVVLGASDSTSDTLSLLSWLQEAVEK